MKILASVMALVAATNIAAAADEPEVVTFDDMVGQVEVAMPPLEGQWSHAEREVAPKLIKELRFTSKEGPAAVLVSTRIRPDLPKDDRVLERIEPKYQSFKQEHDAGEVVVEFRGEKPGRILEFAVAGGEYQESFPYVVGGHIGLHDPPKSITISQFFVTSDRLFEVALYLPNEDKSARDELFKRARKACDEWRASIAVKR